MKKTSFGDSYKYFCRSTYTSRVDGDTIHFEAITHSEKEGQISWKGTVKDGMLEATYLWEKEGLIWDTKIEYWFKGTMK